MTAIQLFGGAINCNRHFHSTFADGVFHQRANGAVELVPALSPTDEDVARICRQVAWRVQRLVERRLAQGGLDEAAQEARRRALSRDPRRLGAPGPLSTAVCSSLQLLVIFTGPAWPG